LWELDIGKTVTTPVHHETDAFTESLRVVDIMITIQVEDERSI
jgi:hypothetical protein